MSVFSIKISKPPLSITPSENRPISIPNPSKENTGLIDNPKETSLNSSLFNKRNRRQKSSPPVETFFDYRRLQYNNVSIGEDIGMFHFPPIIDNIAKAQDKNEKSFFTFQEIERKGKDFLSTKYPNRQDLSFIQNDYHPNILKEIGDTNSKFDVFEANKALPDTLDSNDNISKQSGDTKGLENISPADISNMFVIPPEMKKHLMESHLKYNRDQLEAIKRFTKTQRDEEYTTLVENIEEEEDRHNRMPPIKKYKGKVYLYKGDKRKYGTSDEQFIEAVPDKEDPKKQKKNSAPMKEKEKKSELSVSPFANFARSNCYWYNSEQNVWKPEMRESCTFTLLNGKGYLYGGIGKKVFDDWCSVDLKTFTWVKLKASGDEPSSGRYGHIAIPYQGKIYIFGGEKKYNAQLKQRECLNDVRIFFVDKAQWKYIKPVGDIVEARRNHAATTIGRYIFISGGINYRHHFMNDFLAFDMSINKWYNLSVKATEGCEMPGVSFHACCAVFHPHRNLKNLNLYKPLEVLQEEELQKRIKYEGIYVFGGKNSNNICNNDLYILQIDQNPMGLFKPETKGMNPSARHYHSLNYVEEINGVVCYGGKNDVEINDPFFSDVYILNLMNMNWTKVNLVGVKMPPRAGHCAGSDGTRMIVFGGMNINGLVKGDINMLELDFNQTEKLLRIDQQHNNYSSVERGKIKYIDPMEPTQQIKNSVAFNQSLNNEENDKKTGFKHYKSLIESLDFKNFFSLVPLPGAQKSSKNINEFIQRPAEMRSIPSFIRRPSQVLKRSMSKISEMVGDSSPKKKL